MKGHQQEFFAEAGWVGAVPLLSTRGLSPKTRQGSWLRPQLAVAGCDPPDLARNRQSQVFSMTYQSYSASRPSGDGGPPPAWIQHVHSCRVSSLCQSLTSHVESSVFRTSAPHSGVPISGEACASEPTSRCHAQTTLATYDNPPPTHDNYAQPPPPFPFCFFHSLGGAPSGVHRRANSAWGARSPARALRQRAGWCLQSVKTIERAHVLRWGSMAEGCA